MPPASDRAIALAKEVLAKCMSYDPWFPKPSESMIQAWAEHISLRNPNRDDMLAAVSKAYADDPDLKPTPGHITLVARQMRQDRLMRGPVPDDGLEKITLAEWERRHGERFPQLKVGKTIDADQEGNPLVVACPHCRATVGAPCTVAGSGVVMTQHRAHPSRWDALQLAQEARK